MINVIVSLAAVAALAYALYSLAGIKAAVCPLVSVSLVSVACTLAGMAGLLKAGAGLVTAACFALMGAAVYRDRKNIKRALAGFFTAPVILFAVSCGAMLVFLAVKQPLMSGWDEFSFWGISRKLIKNHDALYTFFPSSMLGTSIPPAMPVLCYFFQRFSPAFTEWICFFAYDVLLFACFACFAGIAEDRDWLSSVMVYISAFLVPFIFRFTAKVSYMETTYISTYSDLPLAMLFAGSVASYLAVKKAAVPAAGPDTIAVIPPAGSYLRRVLVPLAPLAMLVMVKDMGLALGFVAVFIIFVDMTATENAGRALKAGPLAKKAGAAALMLAVVCAGFVLWSVHLSAVADLDRSDVGGERQMGMVQIVFTGLKELLVGPQSDKFVQVKELMTAAVYSRKVCMLGSGVAVVAVIFAIYAAAFVLGDKTGRKRRAAMFLAAFTGFAGYYVFHLLLYVYVFRNDAYTLASYERYMNIYYAGWMCMALVTLAAVRRQGKVPAGCAQAALMLAFAAVFAYYTDRGNIFVSCDDNYPSLRRNIMKKADFIRPYIGREDVIYCYNGDDSGRRWFIYTFELSDNYLVPDIYIETYGLDRRQSASKCQQELRSYFLEKGVTHVLVDSSSQFFVDNYGELFDVPMDEIGLTSLGYYKVNYTDSGFYFTLEKGGYIADGKDLQAGGRN